jgi:hypothetical protein
MALEQYAYLAEIVGVVVVIATFIFLNIQLRQNTQALRSTATLGAHDEIADMYLALSADPTLISIFQRGTENLQDLTPVEVGQLFALYLSIMFRLQNLFLQTQDKLTDDAVLTSFGKVLVNVASKTGFQSFWEQRKYIFEPTFRDYLEANVFSRNPTPGYKPLNLSVPD